MLINLIACCSFLLFFVSSWFLCPSSFVSSQSPLLSHFAGNRRGFCSLRHFYSDLYRIQCIPIITLLQGIEEEEQKALAKLPSIHTKANHVEEEREEGDDVDENEDFKWESMTRVKAAKEEEEEGRREVVTGKSLGVIEEDNFLGVIAEGSKLGVIAEDSDSAVHLDYSSDSLRSEQGRSERGDCERGQFERGQFKRGQFERSHSGTELHNVNVFTQTQIWVKNLPQKRVNRD